LSKQSSLIALLAVAGLIAGCDRHKPAPEQADANAAAPAAPMPAPGAADRSHKGDAALTVSFTGPDGKPTTLAAFKGKPVLLNLWATWCAPCVKEMPTLDAMAAAEAGHIAVVPVSQDLEGAAKVSPFFAKGKFTTLKPYLDTKAAMSIGYQASLPMSVLYDSSGHEIWRVLGGMDWTSPAAKTLLAEAK
jgi:thiol-disulfide isomerase/thioredoxin